MRRTTQAAAALTILFAACATGAPEPRNLTGHAVVAEMHDAYDGKWWRTLTFTQKTTFERPGREPELQTWYEAIVAPGKLRIDLGDPTVGNGVLYTADSLYVIRAGKVARTAAQGNEFLPLTVGVYTQPIATTIRELEQFGFDLDRSYTTSWQNRPAYVVGAASAADTTSAQFWVDQERLILVRMIKKLDPRPDAAAHDIRLDNYVRAGGGWLPTFISIAQAGGTTQLEEYTDWAVDVALSPELFDPATWMTANHWRKTP